MAKGMITVNEAARRKGVSRQAIHYLIKAGKLDAVANKVEKVEWQVSVKSLAKVKINRNMQGGKPRTYCPGCEASLTSTDYQAGECTQCKERL